MSASRAARDTRFDYWLEKAARTFSFCLFPFAFLSRPSKPAPTSHTRIKTHGREDSGANTFPRDHDHGADGMAQPGADTAQVTNTGCAPFDAPPSGVLSAGGKPFSGTARPGTARAPRASSGAPPDETLSEEPKRMEANYVADQQSRLNKNNLLRYRRGGSHDGSPRRISPYESPRPIFNPLHHPL